MSRKAVNEALLLHAPAVYPTFQPLALGVPLFIGGIDMAKDLSPAHCILLAVHLASSGNIKALHSFTPSRLDAFDPELVLRILLTYLPESIEPREYTTYVSEVASRLYLDFRREDISVDRSPVQGIAEEEAKKKVKKLHLLDIIPPSFPPHAPEDILTRFLCHRAYRIDEQTGLLNLVPQLIEPFLDRNEYLRTWYISVVLPLLRLEFEYYPQDGDTLGTALNEFEKVDGKAGIDILLQKTGKQQAAVPPDFTPSSNKRSTVARDVRGLVGPWMYGHTERKRRKLDHIAEEEQQKEQRDGESGDVDTVTLGVRKIELSGVTEEDKTGHDWEYMYRWMVFQSHDDNFPLTTHLVEDWDGPSDVDLGGFDNHPHSYLDEELQRKLELQYAQAAFASCYAAQAATQQTIRGAHAILARLAELLDFIPPPDLASSVQSLPKIEQHATQLDESHIIADLSSPSRLLEPSHPLTTPRLETYMLLQMMVYSAYQFSGLGHQISIVGVAKLHFHAGGDEQKEVLRRILRGLAAKKGDEAVWMADRAKLTWLWNWGFEDEGEREGAMTTGAGVLGKIEKGVFEKKMLEVFTETACYDLAIRLYLRDDGHSSARARLPKDEVEQVVLAKAMEIYDGASHGNRTRGGVKRASDIITAFRPYFPDSPGFHQASALIAATHALSFYSLTLQHGVPFQPVSIRVSHDPIGLIDKVLEQNARSYTKLDDLIAIGRNLVAAGLTEDHDEGRWRARGADVEERQKKEVVGRITFMAIEAALREDDFETAYSYIINRLTPSGAEIRAPNKDTTTTKKHSRAAAPHSHHPQQAVNEDDISWRAAFLAGRYRPSTSSPPTLRRLEQRTELLSLALLLAPTSGLTEILAVWRRCEEEARSLQLSQQAAEQEFDDRADDKRSSTTLPGNFTVSSSCEQPDLVLNQRRREMGRMAFSPAPGTQSTRPAGEAEAPVGLFDLTRSAARALSRNAFPLHGAAGRQGTDLSLGSDGSGAERLIMHTGVGSGEGGRVRKRDMVASAVSGGLARGVGWVLGAPPMERSLEEEE